MSRLIIRWFMLSWVVAGMGLVDHAWAAELPVEAVTTARHDLKLGFTVGGKVESVPVKPGDRVKAGQVLMTLEDEEGQALIELYELRVSSDTEERAAAAQLDLARVEEKALSQAFEKLAASKIEVERAQVRVRLAELEVQMTQERTKQLRPQLQQARARHKQYVMLAPTDGVVDVITASEGEIVEDLKPVVQLVVTDPLWIDVAVPTERTLNMNLDDAAWVRYKFKAHGNPIRGKVIHLAQIADAASNTRLVRVEIPNRQSLPAGSHVMVMFQPPHAASVSNESPTQTVTEAPTP